MPDGSIDPEFAVGSHEELKAFRINGVNLSESPDMHSGEHFFQVEGGKQYRFRIVGIMTTNMIRFSINKHNLTVIATDGYLVNEFPTDILMIHVGERYDFILKTHATYHAGAVFPIRIETLEEYCNDEFHTPLKVNYAYLKYPESEDKPPPPENKKEVDKNRCTKEKKCIALNCPFEKYAPEYNIICHNVRDLQLVNPTPEKQRPQNPIGMERFFNFGFFNETPRVNNIQNKLPEDMPFTNGPTQRKRVQNECIYENIRQQSDNCDKACAHAVFLNGINGKEEQYKSQVVRFVFSSLVWNPEKGKKVTHPIHLHGHSFFVAKIAYPEYFVENDTISQANQDITVPDCGHGYWTNRRPPSGITVNESTVRKDVIAVPAGGYVVIEFLADNPGWWFLHCHIDDHLNGGMAIAVTELPECQTGPDNSKYSVSDSFSDSKEEFVLHEKTGDLCSIRHNDAGKEEIYADEAENQAHDREEIEKKSDEVNLQNLRQKTINAAFNKDRDYDLASAYYERLFRRQGAHANPVQRKFQDRKRDELAELDAFNEQIEESIQHGGNEEYM